MKEKFSQLLQDNAKWQIIFNDNHYDARYFKKLIAQIMNELDANKIDFKPHSYVIAVGFTHLDYFIFTLLASVLGIRLILCDPKMLCILLKEYRLVSFSHILSTKNLNSVDLPLVKLNFKIKDDAENRKPFEFSQHQADLIFFTSGTTSLPKLVVYDENNLFQNARRVGQYLDVREGDKCLSLFPTHYMYGFSTLMNTILNGGTVILERSTITAQEIWNYLVLQNITIMPIIHSVLEKMIDHVSQLPPESQVYFDNLIMMNASDKIYVDDVKNILKLCPTFWNNFGQTEAGPRIFSHKVTQNEINNINKITYQDVIALGKVINKAIEIVIKDDEGCICNANEIGELHYRSPYAMKGYLGVDGLIIKKDFIASGDLVFKTKDDVIFWVGRINETIKLNGKFVNISLLHKEFDECDLIKKSYFFVDPKNQDLNAIFIPKVKTNNAKLKKRIIESFRYHFPGYPRMKNMIFVDEIPTTLSGKVKLRELNNLLINN